MARDLKAKIRLEGDASGANRAIKQTEGAFKRLGNFLKSNMLAITAAVAAGFFALGKAFGAVTDAAKAQEDAVRALDSALLPLGKNAEAVSKSLQAQAAALQQVTKFGDETIIQGQALIASFTKNEEEIKKATAAALDLSAAVGIDLNAAFLLMGKAAAGETTTLTRYGIILDEGLDKSEKFAAALKTVNDQFGGRAAEVTKTYSGAVQQVQNAFGDLLETIGFAITSNETLLVAIAKVRDILTTGGLVEAVGNFAKGLGEVVTTSVNFVRGMAKINEELREHGGLIAGIQEHRQREVETLTELVRLYFSGAEAVGTYIVAKGAQATAEQQLAEQVKATAARTKELADAEEAAFLSGKFWEDQEKKNAEAAKLTKEEVEKLEQKLTLLSTAYEEAINSTKAFGQVTSVQLANEISEISLSLEAQKDILGEHSREYEKLEAVATAKIDSLRARIDNLKDGLGDLTPTTKEAAREVETFGDKAGTAAAGPNKLADANERLAASNVRVAETSQAAGSTFSSQSALFPGIQGGTFTFQGANNVQQLPNGRIIVT